VFKFLREAGKVTAEEMNRVFNNGIGFILVVQPNEAEEMAGFLKAMNIGASIIGEIVPREPGAEAVGIL
jgi:phosphoribosylformylglycinamidine cyclo-ligase